MRLLHQYQSEKASHTITQRMHILEINKSYMDSINILNIVHQKLEVASVYVRMLNTSDAPVPTANSLAPFRCKRNYYDICIYDNNN